jgi:hypothetical protein
VAVSRILRGELVKEQSSAKRSRIVTAARAGARDAELPVGGGVLVAHERRGGASAHDLTAAREAFEALYAESFERVWAFATRCSGDRAAAEALAAAVLARAFALPEGAPAHLSWARWLFAIACDEAQERGFEVPAGSRHRQRAQAREGGARLPALVTGSP